MTATVTLDGYGLETVINALTTSQQQFDSQAQFLEALKNLHRDHGKYREAETYHHQLVELRHALDMIRRALIWLQQESADD